MENMELGINAAEYVPKPAETADASEIAHHHAHEEVAAGGLGLLTRARRMAQTAQLKIIEASPALAPFLETQAACACKAGCPTCAGPTIAAPLWAATKDWASRKFSRSEKTPKELPSLSERPADFVMKSFESSGFPHPAPKPIDPAETLITRLSEEDPEQ